jgi:transposase
LYAERGRPGIAPEQFLRAPLLQVLYGFRSERRLMEEMRYNFALRWLVQWLKAVVMEAHEAQLIDEERAPQELFGTMY